MIIHDSARCKDVVCLKVLYKYMYTYFALWLQCYGHAEQQVVSMELDRREKEALEAETRLQSIGAISG